MEVLGGRPILLAIVLALQGRSEVVVVREVEALRKELLDVIDMRLERASTYFWRLGVGEL